MTVVLKPFDYASDGFTVECLNVGDDRDFGDLTEGLADAGLIEAAVEPAPVSATVAETSKKGGK